MDAISTQLPAAFVARLQIIIPAQHRHAVLQSFNRSPLPSFRVNTLTTTVVTALKTLALPVQPVAAVEGAFTVPTEFREALTHSELASNGDIYIQDIGSMIIADLVDAKAGDEVLDLAAAPGGKTLLLANRMANRGRIAAVEAIKTRFFQLQQNVQLAKATMVECYLKDGRKVGRQVPARFDRVLLDAPCSSESRFQATAPETFQYWSEKKIAAMQRKQKQLLYSAIEACKPGGRIVYSTCSFAPEENEAVIDRQLQLWEQQLDVVPITLALDNCQAGLSAWGRQTFDQRLRHALRLLPNHQMSGFFVCVLAKH